MEHDKLGEVCINFTGQSLDDFLSEAFDDVDVESFVINSSQRIILIGFAIESALSRMIEWLSDNYGLAVNAIILKYIKTSSGNELLSRTAIIPDEIERDNANKKKYKIEMSDEPGEYDDEELRELLTRYLNNNLRSGKRMKEVMMPFLLTTDKSVSREELKNEFIEPGVILEEIILNNQVVSYR